MKFNQPLDFVAWPEALEEVVLGSAFDQPVSGTVWSGLFIGRFFSILEWNESLETASIRPKHSRMNPWKWLRFGPSYSNPKLL